VGHGGELAAGSHVSAKTRPAQIAGQSKVVQTAMLELRRQSDHVRPRGQDLLNHSGPILGTLKRYHLRHVPRGLGPRRHHAHAKVFFVVGTNKHETHGELLCLGRGQIETPS